MTQVRPIRIDFVSDVVCPWCVIGLRGLLAAREAIGEEIETRIVLQPFELNPNMPAEGQNTTEHVREKYGSTVEQSRAGRERIKAAGAELGFDFRYDNDSRIWNTFDAHRLLHWAGIAGEDEALLLKQTLFDMTFTEQQNVSDHTVLAEAAGRAGLSRQIAEAVLSRGDYAGETRREAAMWREAGISGVPSVILEGRFLLQGAQPADVYERAIREVARGRAEAEGAAASA
jgi:predicted DsbA family dithiol-disulfide isomerase